MTRREAELAEVFRAEALRRSGGACAACGERVRRLQAHHVLERSRVKHALLRKGHPVPPEVLWDPRNALCLCFIDHQRHHAYIKRVPRLALPESAFEYAEQHGLVWLLDKEYPEELRGEQNDE